MVEPNEPDSSSDEETHWLIDDPEIPTQGFYRAKAYSECLHVEL